jgi:hypothetical protein
VNRRLSLGIALATEGEAVLFPPGYDLFWVAVIAGSIFAVVWTLVTVLRSSLSDRAKALWVVCAFVVPAGTALAWLVLGRDARKSSPRRL